MGEAAGGRRAGAARHLRAEKSHPYGRAPRPRPAPPPTPTARRLSFFFLLRELGAVALPHAQWGRGSGEGLGSRSAGANGTVIFSSPLAQVGGRGGARARFAQLRACNLGTQAQLYNDAEPFEDQAASSSPLGPLSPIPLGGGLWQLPLHPRPGRLLPRR